MSGQYDASGVEAQYLEETGLLGRKVDLGQLIKWLKLSKNGQAKSVLISGDPGIGKSALLNAFVNLAQQGRYGRVLDLRETELTSPQALYLAIVEQLVRDGEVILEKALVRVNALNRDLGLFWSREDLYEALSLVRINDSAGETKAVLSQEPLIKKIRESLSLLKKLTPNTQDHIEAVVSILVDPWLQVAKALCSASDRSVYDAVQYCTVLRTRQAEAPELPQETSPEVPEDASSEDLSPPLAQNQPDEPPESPTANLSEDQPLPVAPLAASVDPHFIKRPKTDKNLTRHLHHLLEFINRYILAIDSTLLIVLDDWDRILDLPETQREGLKSFLFDILEDASERRGTNRHRHLMVCVAARNEGLSYTLGGSLYNAFQHKLLLAGLPDFTRSNYFLEPLQKAGIQVEASLVNRISTMTSGNPFWLNKMRQFILAWAQANDIQRLTETQFMDLGFNTLDDLLEYSFCRIKLSFLHEEELFLQILRELLNRVHLRAFSVPSIMSEIQNRLGVSESQIFQTLRGLFVHGFLVETQPAADGFPIYQFQSRQVLDFLSRKTAPLQQEVPSDEQLVYLKRIIPLSLKAGELDRQKTQEIIAMNEALGNDDMTVFLENTFLEHIDDADPRVRITALDNLTALPSEKTIQVILACLDDSESEVREQATRSLTALIEQSIRLRTHTHDELIIGALSERLEDDSDTVRAEVYTTLAQFTWQPALIGTFIKGLSDTSDTVRLKAIEALSTFDQVPSVLKKHFIAALEDSFWEVRKVACQALEKYMGTDILDTLVRVLQEDPEAEVRTVAARVLCQTESTRVLTALDEALRRDPNEDVRIAVARSLGKWKGWPVDPVERIFLEFLQKAHQQPATVHWMCVQSLANIGETHLALDALGALKEYSRNEIVLMSIDIAARKIADRMRSVQYQLEHQLEHQSGPSSQAEDGELPPLTLPSEHEKGVSVVDRVFGQTASDPA